MCKVSSFLLIPIIARISENEVERKRVEEELDKKQVEQEKIANQGQPEEVIFLQQQIQEKVQLIV